VDQIIAIGGLQLKVYIMFAGFTNAALWHDEKTKGLPNLVDESAVKGNNQYCVTIVSLAYLNKYRLSKHKIKKRCAKSLA
jgi:hypothetical protein